jgi:hypothetical protein
MARNVASAPLDGRGSGPPRTPSWQSARSEGQRAADRDGFGVRRGDATTGQTVGPSTYRQSSASDWTAMAMPAGADNMCPRHSLGPGRVVRSERRLRVGSKWRRERDGKHRSTGYACTAIGRTFRSASPERRLTSPATLLLGAVSCGRPGRCRRRSRRPWRSDARGRRLGCSWGHLRGWPRLGPAHVRGRRRGRAG